MSRHIRSIYQPAPSQQDCLVPSTIAASENHILVLLFTLFGLFSTKSQKYSRTQHECQKSHDNSSFRKLYIGFQVFHKVSQIFQNSTRLLGSHDNSSFRKLYIGFKTNLQLCFGFSHLEFQILFVTIFVLLQIRFTLFFVFSSSLNFVLNIFFQFIFVNLFSKKNLL